MGMKQFLARAFGGADEASYRIRNAGPGVAVPTKISVYDGPPRDMPLDHLVIRRKRLAEILVQYKARPDTLVRKQSAHLAHALSGDHGMKAKEAAEWMIGDIRRRADERVAEVEHRLKLFDARIAEALKNAGVQQ